MVEKSRYVPELNWRLVALLLNAIAVGSFALIAVTSDNIWREYFKVLGRQFEDIMQFYSGFAWYAVIAGGSIAIATALIEVVHWRFKSGNTPLNVSISSLFSVKLVIGVANIVANLVPMIFIILLNAVIWALIIALSIAVIVFIGWLIFKLFGGEGSTSRGSVPSNVGNRINEQVSSNTNKVIKEWRRQIRESDKHSMAFTG